MKVITTNRKAFHDFYIKDKFEAGVSLAGSEVKSIRSGHINLVDSFIDIKNQEALLKNVHITKYEKTTDFTIDEKRTRKLLLNKREIRKLEKAISEKGYTVIPIKVYLKNGLVKVEIAIAQGKKKYDKRRSLKEKDQKRQLEREFSKYN